MTEPERQKVISSLLLEALEAAKIAVLTSNESR